MTRDMDFIREILLAIEAKPGTSEFLLDSSETDEKEIYHVLLLHEAGLIEATTQTFHDGHEEWHVKRLTWDGHEFLDAARDPKRWHKANQMIGEKSGSLSFDILKTVLTQLALKQVGL